MPLPRPWSLAAEKSSPFLLPPWPSSLGSRGSRSSPVTSEADPPGAPGDPFLRMFCPSEARSGPASSILEGAILIRIILGLCVHRGQ